MGAFPEIEQLKVRKQLLLAKSDVYRQSLQLQYENIRASTAWMERAYNFLRATYPIYVLLAPLVGYFSFKKRKTIKNLGGKAWLGFELFRKLWPLWRLWKPRTSSEARV